MQLNALDYLQHPEKLISEIEKFDIQSVKDKLEFQRRFTGKEGLWNQLLVFFKSLDATEKKIFGMSLNQIKAAIDRKIYEAETRLSAQSVRSSAWDLSKPVELYFRTHIHILNLVFEEVCDIFERIGFEIYEGPEIESEYYNFSALNFPEDHPARDMQDTFFIEGYSHFLLRTHTSPVQIRVMSQNLPPHRFLAPGKVFRCDHDATHSPVFHQIEGLHVDKNVSFRDLKAVLLYFAKSFFGSNVQVRFRPSFFPFTEPSAEMDILWEEKGNKWLEILGCGMVHPNVLKNAGLDPESWTGYAFGMGVERLAMLKYGISDIRLFYENDLRFLTPEMN